MPIIWQAPGIYTPLFFIPRLCLGLYLLVATTAPAIIWDTAFIWLSTFNRGNAVFVCSYSFFKLIAACCLNYLLLLTMKRFEHGFDACSYTYTYCMRYYKWLKQLTLFRLLPHSEQWWSDLLKRALARWVPDSWWLSGNIGSRVLQYKHPETLLQPSSVWDCELHYQKCWK